ncbi:MAG: hypothetical protein GY835_23070 [bacterium]|nr:hypothetical protein [bacterium]
MRWIDGSTRWLLYGILLAWTLAMIGFRTHSGFRTEPYGDSKIAVEITSRLLKGENLETVFQARSLSHLLAVGVGRILGVTAHEARVLNSVFFLLVTAALLGWITWRGSRSTSIALCVFSLVMIHEKINGPNDLLIFDILFSLLLICGFIFLFKYHETRKNRFSFFAGLAFGLSILAKEVGLVVIPAILGFSILLSWRAHPHRATQIPRHLGLVVLGSFLVLLPQTVSATLSGRQFTFWRTGGPDSMEVLSRRSCVSVLTNQHLWHVSSEDVEKYEDRHGELPRGFFFLNYWRWPLPSLRNKAYMLLSFCYFLCRLTYFPLFALLFLVNRRHGIPEWGNPVFGFFVACGLLSAASIIFVTVLFESRYYTLSYYLCLTALFGLLPSLLRHRAVPRTRTSLLDGFLFLYFTLVFIDFAKNNLLNVDMYIHWNRLFLNEPIAWVLTLMGGAQ